MNKNFLNVKGPLLAGVDQLIERYVVSGSAVQSKIFSNLLGDTDLVYYLRARIINGHAGNTQVYVRLNEDGGSNYGFQRFYGASTTAVASRSTDTSISYDMGLSSGTSGQIECMIGAKSGAVRVGLTTFIEGITGTTISAVQQLGASWNNTADEVTSVSVVTNQTDGLGVGSIIELWARRGVAS